MLPIKKILCPIDFSDFSYQTLDNAGELAAHFGAELCVMHATHSMETICELTPYPGMGSWDVSGYVEALRVEAENKLREIGARPNLQPIHLTTLLLDGDAVDEITGAISSQNADLLMIGTHGIGGWRHLVFGSVAEKVIRLASCPILVSRMPKPSEV